MRPNYIAYYRSVAEKERSAAISQGLRNFGRWVVGSRRREEKVHVAVQH